MLHSVAYQSRRLFIYFIYSYAQVGAIFIVSLSVCIRSIIIRAMFALDVFGTIEQLLPVSLFWTNYAKDDNNDNSYTYLPQGMLYMNMNMLLYM